MQNYKNCRIVKELQLQSLLQLKSAESTFFREREMSCSECALPRNSDTNWCFPLSLSFQRLRLLFFCKEQRLFQGTINYGDFSKRKIGVNNESIPSYYYDVQLRLPNLLNDIRSEVERMVKNENSNV